MIEIISTKVAHWASEMDLFRVLTMDSLIRDLPIIITTAPHAPKSVSTWLPPLDLELKLNFNGSSLGNPRLAGIGGLVTNASGACITAYSRPIGFGDATLAETKALLVGLRLIHSMVISIM